MIELLNVCAGYGKREVLKNASVAFRNGTLTSIIGPNGSGKSTLLRAALGIIPHKSGTVMLDGRNVCALSHTELARRAAYLSQERKIPDMSVAELVLHGRFPHIPYPRRYSESDREIAHLAMERMGISELADNHLSTLSGGMRQSAYIAMALAQDTEHIFLDEPLTYLDIAHQLKIMRSLAALANDGRAVITVMHDLPLAFGFSDTVCVMDGGRVLADAHPKELCKSEIIKKIFGVGISLNSDGTFSYKY
ncbi:MAG: ABC transporter ATP-binding protein [Clostridia bacterium]|nr:ABC transporter ATP-binding protein [Clostridia bacterium]